MVINSTTLLGSSSGRNAGDAAIMSGLMEAVDEACGGQLLHEVPTIRPSYLAENYKNCRTKAVSVMPWNLSVKMFGVPTYRSLSRTDLSLIFDAILFDRSLYNPLFNFMSTLYLMMPHIKKKGKKMCMYNVGTGPVVTPHGQKMLRELSELMDFITVRDQASYDILKEIGVQNPRILIGADAALNCRKSDDETANRIIESLGLTPGEEILAVNVNSYLDTWAGPHIKPMGKENFVKMYSSALNKVGQQIDAPMLFVSTQHQDVEISTAIMDRVTTAKKKALLSNVTGSHYDIKAALSKVSLLFGMRLHSIILASGALTPVLGMVYQPKIDHFFEALGLPDYTLGFENVNDEVLAEHILRGWNDRPKIQEQINRQVPVLQAKAKKAAELVAVVDRGEDIDAAFERVVG